MIRYIALRLVQSAIGLLLLSMVVFGLARMAGDPVALMLPIEASKEQIETLRRNLGLDQPLHVQYWRFLENAARGDFGQSLADRRPALQSIGQRLPATLNLSVVSLGFACLLAVPLGMLAAYKRGSRTDTVAQLIALIGQSAPAFWVGLLAMQLFSVRFRLLPPAGTGGWEFYVLPGVTLGWFAVAAIMRIMRSSMIDALDSEFVKFARSKGVTEFSIVTKHALKNATVPVLSVGGVLFATYLTGAVVVETVFAWPGVGRLAYQAIIARDFPLVQAIMLTGGALVVLVNLIVDVLYVYVDPRIRRI